MEYEEFLARIADRIERGKADRESAFPRELAGEDGAAELTRLALSRGCCPDDILNRGLIVGMNRIGDRFSAGKAYIPDLLFAATAMNAAMDAIRPLFQSGELRPRGTAVLGTVAGDLHEIGKNIVRMMLEGTGWRTVDLGVDVDTVKFEQALDENPGAIVCMSALLTTTMLNMARSVEEIKSQDGRVRIFVGGAPVTGEFCEKVGADAYFPEPNSLLRHLAEHS